MESYLACTKDGQLGVTGEGSLLDNAQGKTIRSDVGIKFSFAGE